MWTQSVRLLLSRVQSKVSKLYAQLLEKLKLLGRK